MRAAARFTYAPGATMTRVHYFGTVECVNRVESDDLFVIVKFLLPPTGVTLDTETNRKAGVAWSDVVVSQTASPLRGLRDDEVVYETQHVFNLPWEFHCLYNNESPHAARAVIEVWSKIGERRQQLEGYGLLTLSPVPGTVRHNIGLWRPSMRGSEALKHLFIGGAPSLVDAEDAAIPYKRMQANVHADEAAAKADPEPVAMNSRAGLVAESTGCVVVSTLCCIQTRGYA